MITPKEYARNRSREIEAQRARDRAQGRKNREDYLTMVEDVKRFFLAGDDRSYHAQLNYMMSLGKFDTPRFSKASATDMRNDFEREIAEELL